MAGCSNWKRLCCGPEAGSVGIDPDVIMYNPPSLYECWRLMWEKLHRRLIWYATVRLQIQIVCYGRISLNLKNSTSGSVSLILAGVFMLGVGTYTENGGIQLSGGILVVVGLIGLFTQSEQGGDSE